MDLTLLPADDAAFAPYGRVFGLAGGPARDINAGTSRRLDLPAALDLLRDGGRPVLAVFEARAQSPAGPWTMLERHRHGSQSFVPLGPLRWIVLVALGADRPDPATLAAFALGPAQGVTLHAGTWHHPLIALDAGRFLVVERGADTVDCDVAPLDPAVTLKP